MRYLLNGNSVLSGLHEIQVCSEIMTLDWSVSAQVVSSPPLSGTVDLLDQEL